MPDLVFCREFEMGVGNWNKNIFCLIVAEF
jgi:hypothetical protein